MAPLLQSATTPSDGHAIVTVRGDLDAGHRRPAAAILGLPDRPGPPSHRADLRGMILIDSVGVDVLTRASAWTRRKGSELVLRSASRPWSSRVGAGPPRPGRSASSLSSRRLTPTGAWQP